ncbi:MAG: TolC family protein [bacterium]
MKKTALLFYIICFLHVSFAGEGKLTLDNCINIALEENKLYLAAKIDKDLADLNLKKAVAVALPEISAKSSYTNNGLLPETEFQGMKVTIGQKKIYSNSLSISQPLFNRRTFILFKGAKITVKSEQNKLSEEKNLLVFNVTEAFYGLLRAKKIVSLQKSAIDLMKEHLKNAEALFKNGIVIETDVLGAEMELAKAEKNLLTASQNEILAAENLNLVLGRDPGYPLEIEEELKEINYTDEGLDFYQNETKSKRPALKKIKEDLLLAEENVSLARAGYWPTFSIKGNYNWSDDKFVPGNDSWNIGLTADISLFNGGFTRIETREAGYKLEQVKNQLWQNEQSVLLETKQAYMKLEETRQLVGVNKKIENIAEKNFEIIRKSYMAGLVPNTTVLEAYTALLEARTNKVSSDYDYRIAVARLEKAVGISLID